MEFIKLNIDWDAEPNAPMPEIKILKELNKISLQFYLNSFIHNNISEDDLGVLEFHNCYMYRLGATNDEGFYRGQCRFSKTGVEWGNFYQIIDSHWEEEFPKDKIVLDSSLNPTLLNHYLFYFRDETFECIAMSYSFNVIKDRNY